VPCSFVRTKISAALHIVAEDGVWKIRKIDVLAERRVL
jgi:hypothetical protein